MTATLKQPTLAEFKAWAKRNKELALTVLKAQAYAEIKRKQVDEYIKPIFERYEFYVCKKFRGTEKDERITKEKDLYLTDLDSDTVKAFYAECDAAHKAHGFDGPAGHCPALVAEHLHIQAQNALLDSGEELTGIDAPMLYGDKRKKMLDLLIGACLN